jgi:surface polysaccharide O-acyltransferase-like enzyme
MGYLWMQFDEPLAFQKGQSGWGRAIAPFWVGISRALQGKEFYKNWYLATAYLGIALLSFGIYLQVRASYLVWAALLFGIVVSTSTLESLPRYLSGIISYYVIGGSIIQRWPESEFPLLAGSCMLLSLSVILFCNGYHFT